MSKLRNFFFDLDGVLVDACDWHYHSLNKALNKISGIIISEEEHYITFNGLPTKTKLKMLGIQENLFESIVELKNEAFNDYVEENCREDSIKIELLEFLKSKGGKVCCVTNSIKSTANLVLGKLKIDKYFDLIVSNEEVSANKPDPYPYNHALAKIDADPNVSLAIEDSPKGIESASKSLISVIWKVKNATEVNLIKYSSIFGD
jgi:HAD superfamily hydrolase (TIGR01509 family)